MATYEWTEPLLPEEDQNTKQIKKTEQQEVITYTTVEELEHELSVSQNTLSRIQTKIDNYTAEIAQVKTDLNITEPKA